MATTVYICLINTEEILEDLKVEPVEKKLRKLISNGYDM
jgi:hypothetical protein